MRSNTKSYICLSCSNQPAQLHSFNFENMYETSLNIYIYYNLHEANDKGADQTAQMHMLVCTLVIHMQQSQVFLHCGPYGIACNFCFSPLIE